MAGLEYVHNKSIIHRDIKPENLVFDEDGYLRITDFGIARQWRPENSQDTSGTPGYMGTTFFTHHFSSRGHVQAKSQHPGRLLRCRCDGLRVHVRSCKPTLNLIKNKAALCRQVETRDP